MLRPGWEEGLGVLVGLALLAVSVWWFIRLLGLGG